MAVRAYVETSIPSFYFEARPEPQMVARREWTREWWGRAMTVQIDLVTSLAVIDELERGDFDARSDCLGLIWVCPSWQSKTPALVTPLELLGDINDED
jgi:hypothetical protein